MVLSSADTDLAALAATLDRESFPAGQGRQLQGLNLASLQHPAVLDHYISTSLRGTRLVLIRLLGGRGHWSYGLEQFRLWAETVSDRHRHLVVMAGTADEDEALASLSTVPAPLAVACSQCLREGGTDNWLRVLKSLGSFLDLSLIHI